MDNIDKIHNIFIEHYGEEKVDKCIIDENTIQFIIWYPKITITNEFDSSIDIYDLFVNMLFNKDGTLQQYFKVKKSTYTLRQLKYRYVHSHAHCLNPKRLDWNSMCFGTGPILVTMTKLLIEFDDALLKLFCYELDRYLETESLKGGPYIRMGTLKNSSFNAVYLATIKIAHFNPYYQSEDFQSIENQFFKYIIEKRPFKFNYINNSFGIAESTKNIVLILSNLFIEYINKINKISEHKISKKALLEECILIKSILQNNTYYIPQEDTIVASNTLMDLKDKIVLYFKHNPIKFKIIDDTDKPKYVYILNKYMIYNIVTKLLYAVNANIKI